MPMCFNLFGDLAGPDPELANAAVRRWWPDAPSVVTEIKFEYSPGRLDPTYLGNRSAFDARSSSIAARTATASSASRRNTMSASPRRRQALNASPAISKSATPPRSSGQARSRPSSAPSCSRFGSTIFYSLPCCSTPTAAGPGDGSSSSIRTATWTSLMLACDTASCSQVMRPSRRATVENLLDSQPRWARRSAKYFELATSRAKRRQRHRVAAPTRRFLTIDPPNARTEQGPEGRRPRYRSASRSRKRCSDTAAGTWARRRICLSTVHPWYPRRSVCSQAGASGATGSIPSPGFLSSGWQGCSATRRQICAIASTTRPSGRRGVFSKRVG